MSGGRPFPFIWTPDRTARLVKAWNAGLPASALGERFGVSKASIVNKIGALRDAGVTLRIGENARSAIQERATRTVARLGLSD
ncbi:hypothetical protein [Methylocella sp.]|uniref:hypothetical protein n=1 Tax=Methylocella sp. TaxID=1978226 RepID=UPI00378380E0